jgi:hypothetical protein
MKSGSHHGCFSKGKKHIPFHGLAYHHWNDFDMNCLLLKNTTQLHLWRISLFNQMFSTKLNGR